MRNPAAARTVISTHSRYTQLRAVCRRSVWRTAQYGRLRGLLQSGNCPSQNSINCAQRWARIGPAIGHRIDTLPVQEIILDELVVCIEAQRLMIDVAVPRVWADHDARYPQSISVCIHARRCHVVIKTAPVVP